MTYPPHTLMRGITNWGFWHILALDTGERRWHVIDAYGETDEWGFGEPETDEKVEREGRHAVVYDPRTATPLPAVVNKDTPTGALVRCDEGILAIKLSQGEDSPSWLVFDTKRSVDLVDDEHVYGWDVVYLPVDETKWASRHGLEYGKLE